MARKYEQVAELLRTRIRHGDYAFQEIPPERRLAAEMSVSYMTVRRAIQQLVDDGFLVRQANGRAAVSPSRGDGHRNLLQLAFLAPSYPSPHAERLCLAVEGAAKRAGAVLRRVEYVHWEDPLVRDTISGFDGTFFVSLAEKMPERLREWLVHERPPVVVIDQDMSECGIPSLVPFAKDSVQQLLDYLESIGHRHIDCLSTQPKDSVIAERIEQWQVWKHVHGAEGRLFDASVDLFQDPRAKARETVGHLIEQAALNATALLCTNLGAAIGAVRALADHGLTAGSDMSICAIDGEGLAECLTPSITCIEMPDLAPYLATCIDWISRGGENWIGPLLIRPPHVPLSVGESTVPVGDGRSAGAAGEAPPLTFQKK